MFELSIHIVTWMYVELIKITISPRKSLQIYLLAISLLPGYLLTCYLKFITFPFNIDSYKHLFHIDKLIIYIVTLSLSVYIGRILTFEC